VNEILILLQTDFTRLQLCIETQFIAFLSVAFALSAPQHHGFDGK
jgi:hypothetical protein